METKIHKTLSQWFPGAFTDLKKKDECSDYEMLNHFARYTHRLISTKNENMEEPFKIILLLYSHGTLYEKNAIENEFFRVMATDESSGSLKEHLRLMPEALKPVYIKTILEN